jgi:hypothetical protein
MEKNMLKNIEREKTDNNEKHMPEKKYFKSSNLLIKYGSHYQRTHQGKYSKI